MITGALDSSPPKSCWTMRVIHIVILAVVCFAIYSNNFEHAFHLDSAHVIVNNPSVRSLKNIPSYFADPATFTSLRTNVDYRPVLQISYALNYWMGGYDIRWWHFTQILLHFLCVLGLYFLCSRVMGELEEPEPARLRIAFAAALVFAVHPTASGVVNYLSARSSLLTAAFLLPSIILYMTPAVSGRYAKARWGSLALFTLALFTKVEAIGCLAVYFMHEVWQQKKWGAPSRHFPSDVYGTLNRQVLQRLAPFFTVAAVFLVLRHALISEFLSDRFPPELGSYAYFLTQITVWWYYVANWFAPVSLVSDYLSFPIRESILEGPVLLAVGGWLLIGTFLLTRWKTQPHLVFLAVSALALLSPTSSIVPLSQLANEHRPYLPLAVLSLCWMIPLGSLVGASAAAKPSVKLAYFAGALIVIGSFSVLTYQRNLVFKTPRSFWEDVVEKAPSSRAYSNYGLVLMKEGDFDSALRYFELSIERAPYWHISHINLAIIQDRLGRDDLAAAHYDKAVRYDPHSGTALTWRGEYHLAKGRYADAARDFEQSLANSLVAYRSHKGMASAYAGLGDAQKSYVHTLKCIEIDRDQTARDIVSIVSPFFDDQTLSQQGLDYFEKLEPHYPDAWWVYANIATLATRLGKPELAEQSRARELELKEKHHQ